jgi:hypothetical protein
MARRTAKGKRDQHATAASGPAGNGETTSGYFRKVFKQDPKLLKKGTNPELFRRWLQDHPGHKEVPENVKNILSNIKAVLRNKRKRRRAAEAPAQSTPVVAASPAATRPSGKGLERLEERIDECLAAARAVDTEGLAEVIDRLRNARNQVVRMAGG